MYEIYVMELADFINAALNSGNAVAILMAGLVYVIIHVQRRQTGVQRNAEIDNMLKRINELETKRQLTEKDVHELQRRADSTDKHFSNIENELKAINETLTELCVLMRTIKKPTGK